METPVKILLIEDNPADARLVREWLKEAGAEQFQLEQAGRLDAGLELLTEKGFDIVLLDLGLPDSQGLGALKVLRAQAPATPIVVLTGLSDEVVGMRAVQEGAQDYLLKGQVNSSLLVRSIGYALERKRAEGALRQSRKDWEDIFQAIGQPAFILDPRHVLMAMNRAAVQAAGKSVAELLGQPCWKIFHGTDGPIAECPMDKAFHSGKFEATEFESQGRIYQISCTPIFDEGGRIEKFIHLAIDLTEFRSLEQQLLQAQKMEAVGQLAGGVAHDFNNLLTVILGYSDIVLDGLPEDHPLRSRIEEIKSAGERAAALSNQLLAFSRKQILQSEVLALNEAIKDMTKILQRMIREDIELVSDLDPALGWVKMDPVQLGQVLMNLAVNARDAMPTGGKLTITTRNAEIENNGGMQPSGLPSGPYVTISVADTGCGMTPEVKTHLFEPFFTTKERGKGTGLGLATVYGIVKQSGGDIRIESETGKGTTFTIYLPRVQESLEDTRPVSRAKALPAGEETVLVAEDDEVIRNLIREVLEGSGYTVRVASSGAEALNLAGERGGPIQLLVTDVVMPGMSGPEVAGHLARYRPEMKVLYISGYTDDKIGPQGLLESGAAFLKKPFRIDALTNKVREVLNAP